MQKVELEDCYETAVSVARKVGKVIREAFEKEKNVQTKAGMADLVTETDKRVEDMIIGSLKEKYPSHSFIGEESVAAGEKCCLTDNPTWIIDPIDGTTNFVHRFPYIAVSIGFLVNKDALAGIIYNPILDEMYTAMKGQGAYCNGKKLQATKKEDLSQALLCAEFGSSREPAILDAKFRSMRNVLNKCHGLRSLGSAANNMCQVAAGNVDAYYELGMHCWDIAAGDLIVREAGGVVMDVAGGPLDLMSRRVLCAGTEALAKQVAELLENIDFDRD